MTMNCKGKTFFVVCFDVQYTGISFNASVIKDNLNLVILLLKICDFKVCKNLDALLLCCDATLVAWICDEV
jgi:hypothetical protein